MIEDTRSKNVINEDFESLLEYLKLTRGFDFTGYKRPSLMRRVEKRMSQVPVEDFSQYQDYLEAHPDEFEHLFNTILINVTSFFRDPESWEFLQREVLPGIIAARRDQPIRIWCAGCASGEEAYTVVMVLCELMGVEDFLARVKMYATDIDDEALTQARAAVYTEKQLETLPEELRDKYFTLYGGNYTFNPELRRAVIFGKHDLVQDAPISRLDLLVCRNTLMYLNADTQVHILTRFHFGLRDQGVLFLGKAEMLLNRTRLFNQMALQHRIFTKIRSPRARERYAAVVSGDGNGADLHTSQLQEYAVQKSIVAQILLDEQSNVFAVNEKARSIFGIDEHALGKRFHELEISYKPSELRAQIDKAYAGNRSVRTPVVEFATGVGQYLFFEIEIIPLAGLSAGSYIGVLLCFYDRTAPHLISERLRLAQQELDTTNEELQSTNEELETTNEELHSTNEELETTNEELQSVNEELETINEELQSTNAELEATNQELRNLTDNATHTNLFLQEILSGIESGITVLDEDLQIIVWSEQCEQLWGLRAEDVVGGTFTDLDIGLSVRDLASELHGCLTTRRSSVQSLAARNRKGQPVMCTVRISPLLEVPGLRHKHCLVVQMDATS